MMGGSNLASISLNLLNMELKRSGSRWKVLVWCTSREKRSTIPTVGDVSSQLWDKASKETLILIFCFLFCFTYFFPAIWQIQYYFVPLQLQHGAMNQNKAIKWNVIRIIRRTFSGALQFVWTTLCSWVLTLCPWVSNQLPLWKRSQILVFKPVPDASCSKLTCFTTFRPISHRAWHLT